MHVKLEKLLLLFNWILDTQFLINNMFIQLQEIVVVCEELMPGK